MAQKMAIGKTRAAAKKALKASRPLPEPAAQRVLKRARLALSPSLRAGFVLAPAGYGKTTLLSQWRDDARARAKAWLGLGPLHRDYDRFCSDFAKALAQAGCPELAFSGRPAEDGMACAERLSEVKGGLFLALDGYDEASSPALDRFVRALLGHSSAHVQIALAMRRRANVGAEALAARGIAQLVRAKDLAFQDQEAIAYCAPWLGPDAARALNRWTEGWPGAICLVERAGVQTGPADAWAAVAPELEAYVIEETFEPLEPALKRVLVQTALAPSISAAGINAICARGDGAALVHMLSCSQALVSFDPGAGGLRRHPLLERVARAKFSLLDKAERAALTTKTTAFLIEGGALGKALLLAASAHDPSELEGIERGLCGMSWGAHALVAGQSLEGLGQDQLKALPRLRLMRALARGEDHSHALKAVLSIAGEQEAKGLRLFCAALADAEAEPSQDELEVIDTPLGPLIWASAFALHLRAGHMAQARAWARLGRDVEQDPKTKLDKQTDPLPKARLANALCALAEARPAEVKANADALPQWLVIAAALETGKLSAAEFSLDELMQDWRAWPEFAPDILVEAARAAGFVAGDFKAAAAWARARGWARAHRALIGDGLSAAVRARDTKAAAAFAVALKGAERETRPYQAQFGLAAYALAQGAWSEALARLEALLARPSAPARMRLRALALKARVFHARQEHDQTARAIAAGLDCCKSAPMCATWFEDGTGIWEPLVAHGARLGLSGQASPALGVIADLALARPRFGGQAPLEAASAEEAALLTALAKTGGRAQAAQALTMSENTVKFYLKRIFKKWSVSDWRLAVQVHQRLKRTRVV